MNSKPFTFLAAVVLCLIAQTEAYDPGCSFVNGQCMYNVKLGHANECDSTGGGGSGGGSSLSCCEGMVDAKSDILDLKRQYGILLEKVQELTQTGLTETIMLQKELNHTRAEMQRIQTAANNEILGLRNDLTNAQRDLKLCQSALGVPTSSPAVGGTGSSSGNIKMTYCNFNNGSDFCIFNQLTSGADFTHMTHGSSSYTGPRVDHSTGTRDTYYLGLDSARVASSHRVSISSSTSSSYNTVAKIESNFLEPANKYCIMFYYLMDGTDVKNFDVTIRIGGGVGYPVFSKQGDLGSDWQLGQVELDHEYTSQKFKIDFVASSGAYYNIRYSRSYRDRSDIAIDDVYIYNSSCKDALKCPANSYKKVNPTTNETTCYSIHSTPMTWRDAYDVCRNEGPKSALVSINNKEEQDYLVNLIKGSPALQAVGQNGFYTSGTDKYSEKSFAWSDRGQVDSVNSYTNWQIGQPNNVGGNQDCLLMEYPDQDFTWGDVACDTMHPFICEAKYD